jgi:ribosomal protein S18 acetylase RimI-like enzyme
MTVTVREAQEHDIDFLVDMNRMVHELHRAAAPEYFRRPETGDLAELFRSRLQQPEARVWIASVCEVPVGYAVSVFRERSENTLCFARRFYELEEIGVSPAHRHRGVARALVERVLADAHTQGIRDVELTAWSFNSNAQAAFEALGFRPMTIRFQYAKEFSRGSHTHDQFHDQRPDRADGARRAF